MRCPACGTETVPNVPEAPYIDVDRALESHIENTPDCMRAVEMGLVGGED